MNIKRGSISISRINLGRMIISKNVYGVSVDLYHFQVVILNETAQFLGIGWSIQRTELCMHNLCQTLIRYAHLVCEHHFELSDSFHILDSPKITFFISTPPNT